MSEFGYGVQDPQDSGSSWNQMVFLTKQIIRRLSTMKLVKVMGVHTQGGISPTGTVDVQPLVSQIDGIGNTTPHGTVYGLTYFRLYGGVNAVILDPAEGDIGYVIVADRDSTSAIKNQDFAPPGSYRFMDLADGVYVGGLLNGTPEQYVAFLNSADAGGQRIEIKSPTKIRLDAPAVEMHASVTLKIDADGNGTVFTANTRTDYVIGSTNTTHALNPPQVP